MSEERHEIIFRFLAEPVDVNFGGKVHGGMVMKWIDQAGYAAAVGWAGTYCVTVAASGIQFRRPVKIGDLVIVQATLAHTGKSSMHFTVEVRARNLETGAEHLATSCVIVYVALDAPDGKPKSVPEWTPRDGGEERRRDYVLKVAESSRTMNNQP